MPEISPVSLQWMNDEIVEDTADYPAYPPVSRSEPLPVEIVAAAAVGTPADINGCPLNSTSVAYEASRLVKAGPGVLTGFSGYNSKASAQFILVFASATLPADGAVPVLVITAPTAANFSYDPGIYGRAFPHGVYITNSSTGPTKTIGSADCWFDAQYK